MMTIHGDTILLEPTNLTSITQLAQCKW